MSFNPKEVQYFIGGGITLPLKLINGTTPVESGFSLIESSLRMILAWTFGTRFFLNEFGSRIEALEEPNDEVMAELLSTLAKDAIEEWEKRVEVIDIETDRTQDVLGQKFEMRITYRIKATEKSSEFTYPFYTQIAA